MIMDGGVDQSPRPPAPSASSSAFVADPAPPPPGCPRYPPQRPSVHLGGHHLVAPTSRPRGSLCELAGALALCEVGPMNRASSGERTGIGNGIVDGVECCICVSFAIWPWASGLILFFGEALSLWCISDARPEPVTVTEQQKPRDSVSGLVFRGLVRCACCIFKLDEPRSVHTCSRPRRPSERVERIYDGVETQRGSQLSEVAVPVYHIRMSMSDRR